MDQGNGPCFSSDGPGAEFFVDTQQQQIEGTDSLKQKVYCLKCITKYNYTYPQSPLICQIYIIWNYSMLVGSSKKKVQ